MKILSSWLPVLALGCGLSLTLRAAPIDEDEFKTFKDSVNKRLDQLEQQHQKDQQTIEQNRKTHEQDQQEIQRLKQQLDQTQKTATDAQQKAEAAAQIQPVHPIPEGPAATHNFMVVGDAEVQFGKVDGSHSGFAMFDFAPIFLFRARDNILFEAGLDVKLHNAQNAAGTHDSGSSTDIGLSFATLDYAYNDYLTFVGGDMLLPLGTYSERSAGWLNKIPDDPLPRSVLPGSGVGVQLRGSTALTSASSQSLAYSAWVVNGPSSMDNTGNSGSLDLGGNTGLNGNGDFEGNIHGTPAAGARVGWFYPWKAHYDFELGISGQSGPWDDAQNHQWTAGVVDAALHFGPYTEVKGEYIHTWVGSDDIGTFKPQGWWVQAGYKLAGLNLDWPMINDFEVVGRYDRMQHFLDSVAGGPTIVYDKADRYTVGLVYYLTNTLLLEGDYEFASSDDDNLNHNRLVFQLSFGF
jgi:hypothetical protein